MPKLLEGRVSNPLKPTAGKSRVRQGIEQWDCTHDNGPQMESTRRPGSVARYPRVLTIFMGCDQRGTANSRPVNLPE